MNTVFFAVGLLFIGVVSLAFLCIFSVRTWGKPILAAVLEGSWSARWEGVNKRLDALETDVGELPRVWGEFARESTKAQERARWHVRRAQKELHERGFVDEEIESLGRTLRPVDESGGNGSGLPSLQDPVEEVPSPPEGETWREKALRRKWSHA